MLNNSQGKKQEVEEHRRNVKFSKNKMFVTACNDSLNAKTLNVNFICTTCEKCVLNVKHDMCVLQNLNGMNSRTKMPIDVPISTIEPKRIVNQSVAKLLKRTVASESTNQKPKHTTRKLYEHVSKVCSWWYPKFTPPGYKWKPKSQIGNVNPKVSMPLRNASRTANILEPMTPSTLQDRSSPNPICVMAKVTSSQAWLWHRRLSHLNFDTINLLSKNDIVIGLSKLKFTKDHLCYSYETPEVLIDFLRLVQRGLHAHVRIVRTDIGMEFLNKTLHAYFSSKGILYQMSVARTPEQNGVVERHNRTLVEEKGDACIFVGYSTQSRAYMVFNKRTRVLVETIHVNFDELPQMASDHVSFGPVLQCQRTALEHDSLSPSPQFPSQAPTVTSTENINQAETITENAQVENDKFINIISTPVQDRGKTSSRHVDSSNMNTFYQRHPSKHRWTKDHPLEQVIKNPSQSVRTRHQLESDGEMCMFALTEELHQFNRLDVWELVDRPLCKNVINMKWL
uniref:Integrase catalytic domain-containing protein n=1 Tax=Tanacetum cinerariifolium TaxID=118510 RepID=A0A699JIJ9_TANCI|nr:hypothetical protein [Tanacetum cinerariifolium]